jgi:hypothetical protein
LWIIILKINNILSIYFLFLYFTFPLIFYFLFSIHFLFILSFPFPFLFPFSFVLSSPVHFFLNILSLTDGGRAWQHEWLGGDAGSARGGEWGGRRVACGGEDGAKATQWTCCRWQPSARPWHRTSFAASIAAQGCSVRPLAWMRRPNYSVRDSSAWFTGSLSHTESSRSASSTALQRDLSSGTANIASSFVYRTTLRIV